MAPAFIPGVPLSDFERLAVQDRIGLPVHLAALSRSVRTARQVPATGWRPLTVTWQWALGSPDEGIQAQPSQFPTKVGRAEVPHRVLHPDTPLWYRAEVSFDGPTWLDVRPDDGAQVWWKGERVPARGNQFRLAEGGQGSLIVRVLNKAMWGGLSGIAWAPASEHDAFLERTDLANRLERAYRDVRLLPEPSRELVHALRDATANLSRGSIARVRGAQARNPRVMVGPTVQNGSSGGATIVWETSVDVDSHLEYRLLGASNWLRGQAEAKDGAVRKSEIRGLLPESIVQYRIVGAQTAVPIYQFRTLPERGAFEFAAWADSQGGWPTFRQHVAMMQSWPISFQVGIGDLVSGASREGVWHEFFDCLTPLASQLPTFLTGGNHDYGGFYDDLRPVYFERYTATKPTSQFYAWSAGGARFVALDPNEYFPTGIPEGSEQRQWFLAEMDSDAWRNATWRFVFVHQPPHAQGWFGYHGDDLVRELLEPLIEPKKIDFIVSGHTHLYERWIRQVGTQKVHHIIVGGAGGGLGAQLPSPHPVMDKLIWRHHIGHFRVEPSRVRFRAIATDSLVLDEFETTKP